MRLSTGAELRVTGPVEECAVVCVNGGQSRELEGTWSASVEWLVRSLAPRLPELGFAEVRYRVKSWRKLESCVEDARAAVGELGAPRARALPARRVVVGDPRARARAARAERQDAVGRPVGAPATPAGGELTKRRSSSSTSSAQRSAFGSPTSAPHGARTAIPCSAPGIRA